MADVGSCSQRRCERDRNKHQRAHKTNARVVPVALLLRDEHESQEQQDVAYQRHNRERVCRKDTFRKVV